MKIRIQRTVNADDKPFMWLRHAYEARQFFTEEELIDLVVERLKKRIAGLGSAEEDVLEIDIRLVDAV